MVNEGHLSNDVMSDLRSSTAFDVNVIEEMEDRQRKIREAKLGRMMSKMSTSYPVMQILGY